MTSEEATNKLNMFFEKNVATNPGKWSYYKSQAKKKFDVYPSAYANGWAAKQYKAAGGGWKKESVDEGGKGSGMSKSEKQRQKADDYAQDTYKKKKPIKLKGKSGMGKISHFGMESVNEGKFGKFDTGAGFKGNGMTVYDRNQEKCGDFRDIAHIGEDGKITIYDKNVKKEPKLMRSLNNISNSFKKTFKESVNEGMTKQQADVTLKQLGANKFIAMTGAKQFSFGKQGLGFRIGKNSKSINYVRVDLKSNDLYDMEFIRIRGSKIKVVKKVTGVYNDQLQKIFTKHTGLYTSL